MKPLSEMVFSDNIFVKQMADDLNTSDETNYLPLAMFQPNLSFQSNSLFQSKIIFFKMGILTSPND